MSIQFTRDGADYDLGFDGSVHSGGKSFGMWRTNDDNQLEITADSTGAVFTHAARWVTKDNRITVTPEGGDTVDLIEATEGNIQLRLKSNRLIVDPLPEDDEFSFTLTGEWDIAKDNSAITLTAGDALDLSFNGGLKDSQSQFAWWFEAEMAKGLKAFSLRFQGQWGIKKRGANAKGLLATFAFEYGLKGETRKDTFEIPVEVSADADKGNRLLFSYKRAGSDTQWSVAFAGKFATKGGSLIGYSAEVYSDNGQVASRFTFNFRGKIKEGSKGTRNSIQFEASIAGQSVSLTLSGQFHISERVTITFSFSLNTSTRTGETAVITFGIKATTAKGTNVEVQVVADGQTVKISLAVGADIKLGASRKGSVFGRLDMVSGGTTRGVEAVFGITLN